jgi:predicted nucleic acid-binding protein
MRGDKVFLDTNILVYAHDASAKYKHEIARNIMFELWRQRSGVLSTQVLQEFFYVATSKIRQPLNAQNAKEVIKFLLKWDIVVNNGGAILDAIDIQQEHKFSFWDSMIIDSAVKGGAAALLSEDFSDGQIINGVEVRNPFKLRM